VQGGCKVSAGRARQEVGNVRQGNSLPLHQLPTTTAPTPHSPDQARSGIYGWTQHISPSSLCSLYTRSLAVRATVRSPSVLCASGRPRPIARLYMTLWLHARESTRCGLVHRLDVLLLVGLRQCIMYLLAFVSCTSSLATVTQPLSFRLGIPYHALGVEGIGLHYAAL
jgi:hypothetical protein